MTKEEYEELNKYLERCISVLDKHHEFLFNNIEYVATFVEEVSNYVRSKNLIFEDFKEANLTYQEVFDLARGVIAKINPLFLKDYDNLIKSGELQFYYEGEIKSSYSIRNIEIGTGHYVDANLINIARSYTYNDVFVLVHEFMHYCNNNQSKDVVFKEKGSSNRKLFTEFISIYFEQYAKNILKDEGVKEEDLKIEDSRFKDFLNCCHNFSSYELSLMCFIRQGKIDKDSYKFIDEHFCQILKEQFEYECLSLLNGFRNQEFRIRHNSLNPEREINNFIENVLGKGYQYIIGTVFAFYALDHYSKKDILKLNELLGKDEYDEVSVDELFNATNIDILEVRSKELLGSTLHRLDKHVKEKERTNKERITC